MSAPHIEDTGTDHPTDVAAIRRVIADAERAFNTNDADLLVEHFAENVTAVGVTGDQLDGRAAVLEASTVLFAGPLRDQRARYELADVLFVRPDVALARTHATAIDAAGNPLSVGHAMTALYVLVRENGRWWVVARQNTLVPA
jgi:uncharacterized protein (TIGR02246 family)